MSLFIQKPVYLFSDGASNFQIVFHTMFNHKKRSHASKYEYRGPFDNDVIRGKALESLFVTYRRYTTHF